MERARSGREGRKNKNEKNTCNVVDREIDRKVTKEYLKDKKEQTCQMQHKNFQQGNTN